MSGWLCFIYQVGEKLKAEAFYHPFRKVFGGSPRDLFMQLPESSIVYIGANVTCKFDTLIVPNNVCISGFEPKWDTTGMGTIEFGKLKCGGYVQFNRISLVGGSLEHGGSVVFIKCVFEGCKLEYLHLVECGIVETKIMQSVSMVSPKFAIAHDCYFKSCTLRGVTLSGCTILR